MLKRHVLALAVVVSTGAAAGMLAASGVSTAGETDPHQLVLRRPHRQGTHLQRQRLRWILKTRSSKISARTAARASRAIVPRRDGPSRRIGPKPLRRVAWARSDLPQRNDGSNCEGADMSTVGKRRAAYSLLLTRGLIRIGIDVPAGAEFHRQGGGPVHCGAPLTAASMYRRPLPSTNLALPERRHVGRPRVIAPTTILQDLAKQADDATRATRRRRCT